MQKVENVQVQERTTTRGRFANCKAGETWFFKIGEDYKVDGGKEILRTSAAQNAKKRGMRAQTETIYDVNKKEIGLNITFFAKKVQIPETNSQETGNIVEVADEVS